VLDHEGRLLQIISLDHRTYGRNVAHFQIETQARRPPLPICAARVTALAGRAVV
jgi:hypothetical protein